MRYEVPMPSLGADMEKGKLMKWLIKPHDRVKKGAPLALVETTKSTFEIENFHEGEVLELKTEVGEEVKVGTPIAVFDVEEKSELNLSPKKEFEETTLPTSREVISSLMTKSKKEIPHYYLKHKVKLDSLMEFLDEKNKHLSPEERILRPVLFFKAIILALVEHKEFNSHFQNNQWKKFHPIHLGIVLQLKNFGVIAPAVLNAETLSLKDLQLKVLDLDERAQKGLLRNLELNSATITVTNLGENGVDEVFGVIFPPQVAILGLGKIHEENSTWVMNITLSADHRVTDGVSGSRFLKKIAHYLTHPELLEA